MLKSWKINFILFLELKSKYLNRLYKCNLIDRMVKGYEVESKIVV